MSDKKPIAVMLSKRANVFYLEFCRVQMFGERIAYLTQTGEDVEKVFNIPDRNTAFILLGKGTSITQAAVRRLAESQVLVGFCGSGGSPPFGMVDFAFLNMQSEYRPSEYMQQWARIWFDEDTRLQLARQFLLKRIAVVKKVWQKRFELSPLESDIEEFKTKIHEAENTTHLLLAEAKWAKRSYATAAAKFNVKTFTRSPGDDEKPVKAADRINKFLDHGNYIAYGYAATALAGMGISFMFPVIHGKTRRGALVFDVADLFKDAIVMPLAFQFGAKRKSQQEFREALIEMCQELRVLDLLFGFIKEQCHKSR